MECPSSVSLAMIYIPVVWFVWRDMASEAYVCDIKTECDSKAANGVCDSHCNNLNCSYDSGDCLLQQNPWSQCSQASRCQTSFFNETCDTLCNNEACLYDQLRCKPSFTDDCITNCTNKWGNDVCDSDCNKVHCGYDGNDCNNVGTAITGTMIVYAKSVIKLPSDTARFIGFALSLGTRTLMSVKTSTKYNSAVPEIESLGDPGLRIQYLVQNIPNCNTNQYTVCWTNIQSVANFGAAVSRILNDFLLSIGIEVTITRVLGCPDGYYGESCDQQCSLNCKSGCQIFDGKCIDGCIGSYTGDMCTTICSANCKLGCSTGSICLGGECAVGYTGAECTTECTSGTYGSNCAYNCSLGCTNNVCSTIDGTCSCRSGYNGTMCEIDCADGTYGLNCGESCGNCVYGVACDKVNGTCISGCSSGYYGVMCTDVCPDGKHGVDCLFNCTNCVNDTCYPKTGYCKEGCISGWTGSDCTTNIITVLYENSIATTTEIVIIVVVVVSVVIGVIVLLAIVFWRRGKKGNYQSHLDTQVVLGEGQPKTKITYQNQDANTDVEEEENMVEQPKTEIKTEL